MFIGYKTGYLHDVLYKKVLTIKHNKKNNTIFPVPPHGWGGMGLEI
jgi:hypothetical protein